MKTIIIIRSHLQGIISTKGERSCQSRQDNPGNQGMETKQFISSYCYFYIWIYSLLYFSLVLLVDFMKNSATCLMIDVCRTATETDDDDTSGTRKG